MSDKLFFNYSRSALYFGIKNLKFLKSTDIKNKILIPSYICNTIIQPIKENNLDITFYKINKDLTTDWDDLVSKIDNKLFAVLFVNYFGIMNDIEKYLDLKSKYNFYLIEDSSHGFTGGDSKYKIGSIGDISILSPRKNLPLSYGGVLKLNCKNFIQKDYLKISKQFASLKNYLNYNINLYFLEQKLILKKNIGFNVKNNFLNNELEINVKYQRLDILSTLIIKKFNWHQNSKTRIDNYNSWLNFAKKNNLNTPFNEPLKHSSLLTPWCLPILTKNNNERDKIINWTLKNNYLAFSWTTLPNNVTDPTALYLSNHIICFSTYLNPKKNLNNEI